jgi:DNA-binding MurR/RpiR family transcriptional regulator
VVGPGTVAARVDERRDELPRAERRVAEVVLADPEAVAFGTVADVARRAGTSGATVVRLAGRLGYDGFVELQASVQDELARRLRPATERIRQPAPADFIRRTLARELENVHASLERVDPAMFERAVAALADRRARVVALAGETSRGVAATLVHQLGMLRPSVELASGSEVAVAGVLGLLGPGDVVVALDLRRYDRWVIEAIQHAQKVGAGVVAITDGRLSPLAAGAAAVLTVAAEGAGPFDSHTGMLALANALVSAVAGRLRSSATARLDRFEAAWRASGALVD